MTLCVYTAATAITTRYEPLHSSLSEHTLRASSVVCPSALPALLLATFHFTPIQSASSWYKWPRAGRSGQGHCPYKPRGPFFNPSFVVVTWDENILWMTKSYLFCLENFYIGRSYIILWFWSSGIWRRVHCTSFLFRGRSGKKNRWLKLQQDKGGRKESDKVGQTEGSVKWKNENERNRKRQT